MRARTVFLALGCATFLIAHASPARAQGPSLDVSSEILSATVTRILQEEPDSFAGIDRTVQTVELRLEGGSARGATITLENGVIGGREDMRLRVGQRVVLEQLRKTNGETEYLLRDTYRLPWILALALMFLGLTFLFGGWTGVRSLLGLGVSILVLVLFVVPNIAAGANPLLISVVGSFVIACTSLYLAHGFHRRTSVALLSTLVTLGFSAGIAVIAVRLTRLFGTGSEEAMFLQFGEFAGVNLQGLLLGGIVIGCLGVLDDVTTAQTAAVDEVRKANPALSRSELHRAGMSVGREHIASLINTLALAYAGASLPLLLLFRSNTQDPLWAILNSEFLAEEIVRTLVGSATLLLAVPISTWCAVALLKGTDARTVSHRHLH